MKSLQRKILEQLIDGLAEPVLVVRFDTANWPVVLCNPSFERIVGDKSARGRPFTDVIEQILGRGLALEVSEAMRQGEETNLPFELGNREFLLSLKPLSLESNRNASYVAAYWRYAGGGADAQSELHQSLLNANQRIHDLSRDDPVTGLLNATAFRDVLAHDWAVAAREQKQLALVALSLRDFDEYIEVFGKHAADSCQRRVAQAIRRCLRRASDVAARIDGDSGDRIVVLSHASGESGVREFAATIAAAVRDLGLHHPRSKESKFVTVSYRTSVMQAGSKGLDANDFLQSVLHE